MSANDPLTALGVALSGNASLGLVFLGLGVAATFLMYHLWGHPYDENTRTSAAPRWAMWLHRGIGFAFVACYVVLMTRMVPRLWTYQVELPARTVVHLVLGFTIGFLLIIKISIIRFFRHFEEWMPYLGTAILLCTVLLLALSLPVTFREHTLAHGAPGGDPYGPESRARVARLLPEAGMPKEVDLAPLSTAAVLEDGRDVLTEKCVRCHDLKTILDKPRTPQGWWTTALRMGEKPAVFEPLTDADLTHVTAYLIAITPDLQRAVKMRRAQTESRDDTVQSLDEGESGANAGVDAGVAPITDAGVVVDAGAARDAGVPGDGGVPVVPPQPPPVDPVKARAMFERKCSQCHETTDVDNAPPRSRDDARKLVRRMVSNGLEASPKELNLILWWLDQHYVRKAQ